VIPGCNTPTEMYNAHLLGAQFQKLFPAPEGGSEWVRSALGALPMLQIVPTAGITGEVPPSAEKSPRVYVRLPTPAHRSPASHLKRVDASGRRDGC
jgi:hypothetical protein